jgi:hypothetical protein
MLGLTLIPLGGAIAATARLPRAIGYLMGLSGLAYIMQGCVLGTEGFSGSDSFAILGGYVVILAWIPASDDCAAASEGSFFGGGIGRSSHSSS